MSNPMGVFTVDCPKATRNEVPNVEYNIYKGDDPIPLMIVKNQISFDDVQKAGKCAGFTRFIATNIRSYSPIGLSFPLRCSISIREYVEYKIVRAFDNKLIAVVPNGLCKSDIERAALDAGFGKEYTIEYNKCVEKAAAITSSTVIKADVYLRRDYTNHVQVFNVSGNTPTMQVKPVEREFKICDVTGKELMIVKGSITASDAHKSIRCAGFKGGEAHIYKKGTSIPLKGSDFPIQCDLVVMKKTPVQVPAQARDPIFHICESTSVPPAKKPTNKIVQKTIGKPNPKQKLIRIAIDALSKLEKII